MKRQLGGSSHAHPVGSEKIHRVSPAERREVSVHCKSSTKEICKLAVTSKLSVVWANDKLRVAKLAGSTADFERAFDIEINRYLHENGDTYIGHDHDLVVPHGWHEHVTAILGLDQRPIAKAHFRRHDPREPAGTFTPAQVADLYGFPPSDGAGQCVGIIELDGGFNLRDLRTYLNTDASLISAVDVDHARNDPTGDPDGPDGEVMLDIEVVASVVPAAKIVVYFATNTEQGFIDGVNTAIHDQTNKPGILSISWGGPESSWSAQALAAWDQVLQSAVAANVTIFVASGDSGSSDGTDGNAVDFPASSPWVTACGGTYLVGSGTTIESEVVWDDQPQGGASGGGYSTIYPAPNYQTAGQSGRGVPDVAGDAAPKSGYQVLVDGDSTVVGGTSAVAPLWAGLFARINAITGSKAGFVSPKLYANPAAFREITSGTNGTFTASSGWNPCCGLGSPNGAKILAIFQS